MAMAGVGGGQPSIWTKPVSSLWVPPALLRGDNTGRERGMGCLGNRGVVRELVTPAVWDPAGHAAWGWGLSSSPAQGSHAFRLRDGGHCPLKPGC